MLTTVKFISREDAENLHPRPEWAIVSITETQSSLANLKDGWSNVCRVQFHDIEPGWETKYPEYPDLVLFNDTHANAIIDFVQWVSKDCDTLIVHCKAGVSRSAAVAKWVASMYNLPFNEKYSLYNKHVLRIMEDCAFDKGMYDDRIPQ